MQIMSPALPRELLDDILSDADLNDADYVQLCLASRDLLSLARKRLYHTLDVVIEDTPYGPQPDRVLVAPASEAQVLHVVANAHLADLSCPHIDAVSSTYGWSARYTPVLHLHRPRLRQLHGVAVDADVWGMLVHQHWLERLTCSSDAKDIASSGCAPPPECEPPFHLKYLRLYSMLFKIKSAAINALFATSFDSLLTLDMPFDPRLIRDFSVFPSLRSLVLHFQLMNSRDDHPRMSPQEALQHLCAALSTLMQNETLRSLETKSTRVDFPELDDVLSSPAFGRALPASLKKLGIVFPLQLRHVQTLELCVPQLRLSALGHNLGLASRGIPATRVRSASSPGGTLKDDSHPAVSKWCRARGIAEYRIKHY
ncbi:hypothetical protein Rhopal_001216-T1 [Rhodotorula paludigena]|uniref:F-box domain-containing protein n=1 Tax=Rhodotorula paludigena TaxID=86838 RepID=A0AAV5G6Q7_9BASI|nr:hypothetical protein Rhopal_001216-T1 [Rhodotorula paludigena]